MDFSPETVRLMFMLIGVISANALAVVAIRTQLKGMDKRIEKNEAAIQRLYEDTRYIMTGNEIRRIVEEAVKPLSEKVDVIHEDVIVMKSRNELMRTRIGDPEQ